MSVSLWILSALIILIMLGAGQRILDQMRLNDKQAIMVLLAIIVGIIIPPVYIGKYFCFSIGGFLIPLIICVYMLVSAGWRDVLRAIIGIFLVGGVIYLLDWLLPAKTPEDMIIDPMYVYGIVAGIIAYSLGRSRRNAFVSCVLGISLAMLIQFIINMAKGAPTILGLGVGGAFGTVVIATIISVALCEFLGRAFTCACPDQEEKEFNFETHTYDSEKNGKLNKDGTKALVTNSEGREIITTSDSEKVKAEVKPKASKNNSNRTAKANKKGAKS